jgi:hypothetical protein
MWTASRGSGQEQLVTNNKTPDLVAGNATTYLATTNTTLGSRFEVPKKRYDPSVVLFVFILCLTGF